MSCSSSIQLSSETNSITHQSADTDLLKEPPNQHDSISTLVTVTTLMDRRVTFATEIDSVVTCIPSLDDLSAAERRAVWWRQRHFQQFRRGAKVAAFHARAVTATAAATATATATRTITATNQEQPEGSYYPDAKHYASLVKEENLSMFLANVPGNIQHGVAAAAARGLEHWTSRAHHEGRRQVMREARKIVLKADPTDPAFMAERYQEATRASRILARWLGQADALAVLKDGADEEEQAAAVEQEEEEPSERKQAVATPSAVLPGLVKRRAKTRELKLPIQHRGIA